MAETCRTLERDAGSALHTRIPIFTCFLFPRGRPCGTGDVAQAVGQQCAVHTERGLQNSTERRPCETGSEAGSLVSAGQAW